MKHSQKARMILCSCMLMIGVFSAIALYRAYRPSVGLPYEQVTMDKAKEFMDYEEGYILADVRPEADYAHGHVTGAVNLPYDTMVENAYGSLPDKTQMIYVYGEDDALSAKACFKLSEQGYTNVTQITGMHSWIDEVETERTQ